MTWEGQIMTEQMRETLTREYGFRVDWFMLEAVCAHMKNFDE